VCNKGVEGDRPVWKSHGGIRPSMNDFIGIAQWTTGCVDACSNHQRRQTSCV
jgi:hypothetical protein